MSASTEQPHFVGPIDPVPQAPMYIPGSNLVCSAHVNCTMCNHQVWISCQHQGHVVMFIQTQDGKITEQLYNKFLQLEVESAFAQPVESTSLVQPSENAPVTRCSEASSSPHSAPHTSLSWPVGPQSVVTTSVSVPRESNIENSTTQDLNFTSEVQEAVASDVEDEEMNEDEVSRAVAGQNLSPRLSSHESDEEPNRKLKSRIGRPMQLRLKTKLKTAKASKLKTAKASKSKTVKASKSKITVNRKNKDRFRSSGKVVHVKLEPKDNASVNVRTLRHKRRSEDSKTDINREKSKRGRKKKETKACDMYFHCELCNSNVKGKSVFANHMRNHIKPKVLFCDICGKAFRLPNILKRHKQHVHDGIRPHQCDMCDKSYPTKSTLKLHKNTHLKKGYVVCHLCGKCLSNYTNFKRHIVWHSGHKGFSCDYCGKRFFQKVAKMEHQRTHTGETPYPCEICGKGYRQLKSLKSHIALHLEEKEVFVDGKLVPPKPKKRTSPSTVRPHACDICGKCFVHRSQMNFHKRRVHLKIWNYSCPECDKKFPTRQRLDDHYRIHTGEKPWKCRTCGKSFGSRANRNRHELVHTGVKPHKCSICGKQFSQRVHLKSHLKGHEKMQMNSSW